MDNKPENQHDQLEISHLNRDEVHALIRARVSRIDREFSRGFDFIKDYTKSVSFFGSARFKEDNPHYIRARTLAGKIIKELGYTILSGGGNGIMEASNRGAFEAGGESVGLNIKLPTAQPTNAYLTKSMEFTYFFVRKVALSFAAEAYLFFPGGFGTLDEFFEIITLIQTKKIPRIPVIMVGRDYWTHLNEFIQKVILEEYQAIDADDMKLYTIADSDEEIINIIKNAPIKHGLSRTHN